MTSENSVFLATGVVLCFVALSILVLVVLGPGRGRIAMFRRRPGATDERSLLTKATEQATSFVERRVGRSAAFGSRDSLEQAGLKMSQADFILLVGCSAVTAGIIGFFINGFAFGVLFLLAAPVAAIVLLKALTSRRRAKFEDQLGDTLQMLAGGLRAGHSLLRSVDAVSKETEAPTSEELSRIVNETRLGRELRESMQHAAQRLRSDDFDWTGQAIEIHREVGGDLAEVLDHVGETIRERAQIKGQVKSLSAEGRLSAYILTGLPIVVFLWLSVANPSYVGTLYTTVLGWIMLVVGTLLLAAGAFWLSRVIKIKF
ncbi:type II secretion system F family protein [Arthrobacter sp. MA-N2]|uniref:type II secretion system F family protein n=1 Tax=Arthrobacter sp. MA-N2 TaxID=1101188 RepID=UPI0004882DA9|nr:type II secretion system F family protein [Arthrobacter sp. MA-N2]